MDNKPGFNCTELCSAPYIKKSSPGDRHMATHTHWSALSQSSLLTEYNRLRSLTVKSVKEKQTKINCSSNKHPNFSPAELPQPGFLL